MVLTITDYTKKEHLILVSEIIAISTDTKFKSESLTKKEYEFTIKCKNYGETRFWFNEEKERFEFEYEKAKNAFIQYNNRDVIAEQVRNYLKELSNK